MSPSFFYYIFLHCNPLVFSLFSFSCAQSTGVMPAAEIVTSALRVLCEKAAFLTTKLQTMVADAAAHSAEDPHFVKGE